MKFSFVLLLAKKQLNKAMTRILCVAEKNDAAKNIAALLSRGTAQRTEGRSTYNKIYRFEHLFHGQMAQFAMTSVSGHLITCEFTGPYKQWRRESINELFDAPITRMINKNMEGIERTLLEQSRVSQILIIWTDCDREGEHIGSEIIHVCRQQNPNIRVFRAKFSEITAPSVNRALQNVIELNQRVVDAVDCRMELDLRIGAAFTRLQTLHLQNSFPDIKDVVSYGSCQFPTLGFIVERYKSIKEFIAEPFWRLVGRHIRANQNVEFIWERNRLFDRDVVNMFLQECREARNSAKVVTVREAPKSRWRPTALDTVEFEKLCIRKLKISGKEALAAAERLYTAGYISYPRTETNMYPKDIQLRPLVECLTDNPEWGPFAMNLLQGGGPNPRNGRKSDQAHPPIHPLKLATRANLRDPRDFHVYELIVRHFLACLSRDATGKESTVEVVVADEVFKATGLIIEDQGYLEVWKYDKWSDKTLPKYRVNEILKDFVVTMDEGRTTAPQLLSEADLIALMEKHGIGTDATHAEHIEKIKTRSYCTMNHEKRFIPGYLGLALVDAYNEMGYEMSKPVLRSHLERELVEICEGRKSKDEVLREQIRNYKNIFITAENRIRVLSDILRRYIDPNRAAR